MKRESGKALGESVYDALEERILNGEYQPGESLTEIKLSREFQVSRTPVREALRRLERAGLVEIHVNCGAVVTGISPDDLKEMYTIRMYIEGLAARWAAEHISQINLSRLERCVECLELGQEDSHEADSAFHQLIYDSCHSRLLKNILTDIHNYLNSATRFPADSDRQVLAAKEHRAIFEAVKSGNAELAERLAKEHVSHAYEFKKN